MTCSALLSWLLLNSTGCEDKVVTQQSCCSNSHLLTMSACKQPLDSEVCRLRSGTAKHISGWALTWCCTLLNLRDRTDFEEEQFLKLSRNCTKRPLLAFKGKVYECDKFRNKQELTLWTWKEKAEGTFPWLLRIKSSITFDSFQIYREGKLLYHPLLCHVELQVWSELICN